MKKNRVRRLLAIICAITLLPLGYFAGITSNAAEEIVTSTTIEEWTIRDLFMPDRWYDSDYTSTTEGNMINTTFTTYISFPNDGNTNLWLGNELNGFVFQGQSGGVNMMHYGNGGSTSEFFALMTSDVAGVELLNNPNLKMTVTVEQSGETGIKVGVYFNDVLYGGSFFEKEGITAEMLPKSISIRRYNGTTQKVYLKSSVQSEGSTEVPTNLENITLSNAGIADGTNSMFSGDLGVSSLDGTLFSAKLQYNANFSRFHFGIKDNSTNAFSGISFRLDGDTLKISNEVGTNGIVNLPFDYVTMDAETAGVGTTFNNTKFLLQISTEYVDHDRGGIENDIKFGVFINGELYDNQYFYIKDGAEQMGTQINFNEGVAVSYSSYFPYDEATLESWTIRDLFMPDRWYDTYYASTTEGNLANTSFSGYISFPDDGNTNLWIGAELNGFALAGNGENVVISHWTNVSGSAVQTFTKELTSEIAKVDLTGNENLKVTVTIGMLDCESVKVGVYFNDVLYNGEYFEITGVTQAMLPKSINIRGYNSTNQRVYMASPMEVTDSVPTNLTNITLSNAGIENGTNSEFSGDLGVESLDGTLFSAKLQYNANFSRFHFGVKDNSTNAFTGISFRLEGDVIKISNEVGANGITNLPFDYVTMDAATAGIGTTFNNTKFLLQISTEYVDHDNGGTENDIKLGVFINGKLYDNQYFYIKDGAEQLGTQINFNEGAAVFYQSYVKYNSNGLEEWTIRDVNLADGWYGWNSGIKNDKSLVGTSFISMINFPDDGLLNLWVGEELNGFALQGKGESVILSHYAVVDGETIQTFTKELTSEVAGLDLTRNEGLKVALTVETVSNGSTKVGVFFNDILYGASYFEMDGITSDMLPQNIQMRIYGEQRIYLEVPNENVIFNTKEQSAVSYNLDNGTYLITGDKVTVNDSARNSGDVLDTPGDYIVKRLVDATELVQQVSLYYIGDIDLDGIPAQQSDLEKLKELLAGITNAYLADSAAEYAADLDNDEKVGFKDVELMEAILNGSTTLDKVKSQYHVASLSYDYLGGDDVMPIVGFSGPENEHITEESYQLVKDTGVNLISFTPNEMGTLAGYALKAIEMAEQYELGYFMVDTDLNAEINIWTNSIIGEDVSLSMTDIADYLSRYSHYENFLGSGVKDEPWPNATSFDSDSNASYQLKYYDNIAETLNSYVNNNGFINAFPSSVDWIFEPANITYEQYLQAIVTDTDQKVLSFDHYPFSSIENSTNASAYFTSLQTVRKVAENNNIPFWGFVQAGGDWRDNQSSGATDSESLPTEAETYWNVNTMLAFGAKGIEWFPLIQPTYFAYDETNTETGMDYDRNGLIGADYETTPFYAYAQKMNAHVAAIDEVLMKSTSKGIIAANPSYDLLGTKSSVAKSQVTAGGVTLLTSTDMLTGVEYETSLLSKGDGALVGCFDYRETEAFYIVNYDVNESQKITLSFNASYDYRQIQNAITTYGTGSEITLTIPAGEAVLIVLEDRVVEFAIDEYATYRLETGNLVPDAEPGYVFAGWYSDKTCTNVMSENVVADVVYAKFVDEKVLSVKAQITAETTTNSSEADIRFVTTVDSLDYQEVGYDITIEGRTKKTVSTTTVYEKLYKVGSNGVVDGVIPSEEFSTVSKFFNTYAYWKVPNKNFKTKFTVTPYWVTKDGTVVYGTTAVKNVAMGI